MKLRCIGKKAHARGMYVAKKVMVAECVLGILVAETQVDGKIKMEEKEHS